MTTPRLMPADAPIPDGVEVVVLDTGEWYVPFTPPDLEAERERLLAEALAEAEPPEVTAARRALVEGDG